jgi:hypothetical protein
VSRPPASPSASADSRGLALPLQLLVDRQGRVARWPTARCSGRRLRAAAERVIVSRTKIVLTIGHNPEEQLVAFVRGWFKHLARAEWDAALGMIDEPNTYGISWTRESITALVAETFGANTRFAAECGAPVFSDPDLATGRPHPSFGRFDAGGFWLNYDVPLNGEFSDLTAQFEFEPRHDRYAVILHDLHVL